MHWYQEEDDEEEDLMFSPALLARRASESWIIAPPVEVHINTNTHRDRKKKTKTLTQLNGKIYSDATDRKLNKFSLLYFIYFRVFLLQYHCLEKSHFHMFKNFQKQPIR